MDIISSFFSDVDFSELTFSFFFYFLPVEAEQAEIIKRDINAVNVVLRIENNFIITILCFELFQI